MTPAMELDLAEALVAKAGNVFLVTPRDGELPPGRPHPHGLWYRDCRFLRVYALRVGGERPALVEATDEHGDRTAQELAWRRLALRRERTLAEPARLRERLALRSEAPVDLSLELELGAAFEPMLALRGIVALVPATVGVEHERSSVRLWARGRDGVRRQTSIELGREPDAVVAGQATVTLRFDLRLAAGGCDELGLEIVASESGDRAPARRRPRPPRARVSSDSPAFDALLGRSFADLDMLRSELSGRSYYAAGVPWYATLFGRDSLIAATQTLAFEPDLAADTLRLLGNLIGRRHDPAREEQPGRILHELRVGEPAALGETPFARYYGSVDATPLWLCLLAEHARWTGSLDLIRELRPEVDAAVRWMGGDGPISYRAEAPGGLVNQGWRDSPAGVPDAAGAPLAAPIALVEVQGYAIRALRDLAGLLDDGAAQVVRERADALERELERLWLVDAGTYAIALDGAGRPGTALSSNPGHLLWAGTLTAERAAQVRDVVMAEPLFSGWGVRTLGAGHAGYDPLGYHTGSVWPHDSALIARGLREYGFDDAFGRLLEGLLAAAARFPGGRLPELFGGQPRAPGTDPVPYPVACRPQAWAAGTVPYLLATALGLRADGLAGRLRLVRPMLPPGVGALELDGLSVGDARVALRLERRGGFAHLADVRVDGELEVAVEGAGAAP